MTIILVHVAAMPAGAQVRPGSVEELRGALAPGDEISVAQVTGGAVNGGLLEVGTTDLVIRPDQSSSHAGYPARVTIPFGAIRSLERPGRNRVSHAFITASAAPNPSLRSCDM